MTSQPIDFHPNGYCLSCEAVVSSGTSFCPKCTAEIERDIALDDAAPRKEMTGHIFYGLYLPDYRTGSDE